MGVVMSNARLRRYATLGIAGALLAVLACESRGSARAMEAPASLSDQEFWKLSTDSSEPGGYFRNADLTNFTSNEMLYQYVLADLLASTKPGGVYLGVGPEQNYTYMAALKPKMAIIFDIRRGNLDLQLMYKAIFELSKDRADFVSMLFSKPRPEGLGVSSSVAQIFGAFGAVATSATACRANAAAIRARLTQTHGWPLGEHNDLAGIDAVYEMFYQSGFALRASPTYADLMTASDARGAPRSFLASEDRYQFLRQLELQNLVVPVVGDFGGPKAIRAIGHYLKGAGAVVQAFYLSNVEQYLVQDGKWDAFCRSVATLPLDSSSTFIRSASGGRGGGFGRGVGFVSTLGNMASEVKNCGR
jgi:hypothetical protein